jgi:hypothetical protein
MNNLVFNTTASQLLVTVGNATLTISGSVTIAASAFTSATATANVTGTGYVFADTDISTKKVASMFVYNEGANTLTLSLMFSPDTTSTHYIIDPNYSSTNVAGTNGQLFIDISKFAHYVQLYYDQGTFTGTFSAYLNTQA